MAHHCAVQSRRKVFGIGHLTFGTLTSLGIRVPGHFIAIAVLCVTPIALADDDANTLTLASYNVENYFDVFDDPYVSDEGTPVKSRRAIMAIAKAIRAMDADVVAFEELENEWVLHALVVEFLADMGYDHIAALPTNSRRGINLGIISRKPIERATSHRWLELKLPGDRRTWQFARDLAMFRLRVTVEHTLDLYVVHLKSRRSGDGDPKSAKWRLAEATAVQRVVSQRVAADPTAWVAVVGDFNDTPDTDVYAKLTAPDAEGRATLIDLHATLPDNRRITYLSKPFRSTVDYIFASPALARHAVANSARVINNSAVLAGSDHAPVVVTFELGQ